MVEAQGVIDFVMANKAFFAFLATLVGYVITKVKGTRKDERIDRQHEALRGVARAVEEFQKDLNEREPLAVDDPRGLKKAIAYRVSRGREELDEAITRMDDPAGDVRRGALVAAKSAARAVLP
jgi:hypothetical protein